MMGNTKSALQLESHRRFPFEPRRGCSHPARTPATRTDCQGRKHTPLDRTPEKTQKGRLARVICAREMVRQTPCRLRVTLFSSSESPREQKGVGIRRRTLKWPSVGMQFPESSGNIPREIRQSRLKTGKQPKRPEVRQSKLTCLVNTIILDAKWLWIKTLR